MSLTTPVHRPSSPPPQPAPDPRADVGDDRSCRRRGRHGWRSATGLGAGGGAYRPGGV